jgi:hypothetical protein
MTIIVTAVYSFGIVMGADSEELSQEGLVLNGEQEFSSREMDKIIEIPEQCVLLGMAGDSQIYINGRSKPVRDWLISNYFDSENPRMPLRQLAATIWAEIDNQPKTEYGQNSPSTLLLFGYLASSEGYEISNAREFVHDRGMSNHFVCKRVYIPEDSEKEPAIFMAGFPEAQHLFRSLFCGLDSDIEPTLRSFLSTADQISIAALIEDVRKLRLTDRSDMSTAKAWLQDCLRQICSLWKLADLKGISEPVHVYASPRETS